MKVALSTMWWEQNGSLLHLLAQRTRDLGFRYVELGYRLTEDSLPAVDEALQQSGLLPSSVHAPFPGPPGPHPLREADLSAVEAEARARAEDLVARSLEEAAARGAQIVVLHAGNVEPLGPLERELDRLFEAGRSDTPTYAELREELLRKRDALAPRHLEWVREALSRLAARAQALGVRIALENRAHFRDLPSFPELAELLDTFAPTVGYWHDAGHAFRLAVMGFWSQESWLQAYGNRLLGIHLHDCVGLTDHQPPGYGHVPFAQIAPLLPASVWRVFEVDSQYEEQALASGVAYLRSLGVV
ncbi:MAG: sugar phosphate isomerase/epimerase family protein [Chloroflexia bacterium]